MDPRIAKKIAQLKTDLAQHYDKLEQAEMIGDDKWALEVEEQIHIEEITIAVLVEYQEKEVK